jgi:hypothetical protein
MSKLITNVRHLDQMRWAEEFLCALDDLDHRHIMTVFFYYPNDAVDLPSNQNTPLAATRHRMLPVSNTLDIGWFIEQEWGAEAGNMLLSGSNTRPLSLYVTNIYLQCVGVPSSSFVYVKL